MAQGTFWRSGVEKAVDADDNPVAGALANFYVAGLSTPLEVFGDVLLTVSLGVQVEADGDGVFPQIFIPPGTAYKVDVTTPAGASLPGYPSDNLLAVPTSASNLEVTGTAGEALLAGKVAYLSDGSGGKTAGQWYLADADNTYSSTLPVLGIVPSDIDALDSGTIRLGGRIDGLTGLSVGSTYYVSATAGALTSTAPANSRFVGVADSTTSLVLSPNPPTTAILQDHICLRLTLTAATPVTTSDVTAATAVKVTPYKGNLVSLYNGVAWQAVAFTEQSISLGTDTADLPYDVFGYLSSGAMAVERLAWTNTTTRATALTLQDGRLVKTGDATRRYLGTYCTTSVAGQCEDSLAKRLVWNYYNRVPRAMKVTESTGNWNYTTAAYRQANGAAANRLMVVVGVAEVEIDVRVIAEMLNATGGLSVRVGIGEDATTLSTSCLNADTILHTAVGLHDSAYAFLRKFPAVGRHTYTWLENSDATGTTTWFGGANHGISGSILG